MVGAAMKAATANRILSAILIALVLAIGGWLAGRSEAKSGALDTHEKLDGHPVIVERVGSIEEDVDKLLTGQGSHKKLLEEIARDVRAIKKDGPR